MCLGAIYWARPKKVYYANTHSDAADIDFDDKFIYQEINLDVAARKLPFEQMIKTNFLSTVYGVCASLPLLRKAIEPHIVIMSSSVVYLGLARAEAYGASKAAVRYFAQALNVHLASVKIPVSIIYPGFVKTALTDKNDFPMPFLISAHKAANYIFRGIVNYKSEIRFPFALILGLRLLGALPAKIQAYLLKNMVNNK
jgi:short-subunit dehydrogenase